MNPGWIVFLSVAGLLALIVLFQWRAYCRDLRERHSDAGGGRAQLYDQERS